MLFIWNVTPVVYVNTSCSGGSPTGINALNISDITQFFVYLKSNSISKLIDIKFRDLQILLEYFNGTRTPGSIMLLLFGVFSMIFVLHSKDLLVTVLFFNFFYLTMKMISIIIFIVIIIHFISAIIPQISWCHRIIVTWF